MPYSAHPPLPAEVLLELYAHARREAPRECCGVVYGEPLQEPGARWLVRPARNIQDELHAEDPAAFPRTAATAYHLDAESLFALARSLGTAAPARVVYHSHLEAGAYFSATDQEAARLGARPAYPVEHLVIDVRGGRVWGAAQFAWSPAAAAYVKVHSYPGE
ncbi:MAG: Mov34/MPN/PAD-1 family protein [Kofleriaceae bacterium]